MRAYGSRRTLRTGVIEALQREGRNPNAYNIAGIMRDAFHDRGPSRGYEAGSQEAWRTAVSKYRRPFGVGDMVRVVLEVDGLVEHHYGRIAQFRKANGGSYGSYGGTPVKPHSAHIELVEHGARTVVLTEVAPAEDDFEIITDWSTIHQDAMNGDGYFRCLDCGGSTYKGAEVKVVHKVSGQSVRLCRGCDDIERRVRLGHSAMWAGRSSKETIFKLRENPTLITGPDDDYDADMYRQWADALPYLVPDEAAALYAKWREQRAAASA